MEARECVVLITGASSGLGCVTAMTLAEQGYRVFGTSRKPDARQHQPFVMLPLDVRDDLSVQACVQSVLEQAGRIDVLINNAGYGLCGALEETPIAQARELFETNFFGVVRMVNAVLPTMRRQGSGAIINVSSLVGLAAPPFAGIYAASKHALEGYTEALRQEVKSFQIRVSLVEPGGIRTNFTQALQTATQPVADYDGMRTQAVAYFVQVIEQGIDPQQVVQTMVHILRSPSPRLRYPVGADSRWIGFSKRMLPEPWMEAMGRWMFRLDHRPIPEAITARVIRLLWGKS